jgi:tetratricopeptide (TPR) repeat protein
MQSGENENIADKINNFVKNNRKAIFITIGLLLALFIGLVVYLSISDSINKKATALVDELTDRYNELDLFNEEDYYTEDVENLLADLKIFTQKYSRFPGSKGWAIIAQIYSERKDWVSAQEAWLSAAKTGDKTYLGPVALFNAAAAAEEQGNLELAIELLEKCLAHKFEFPAAARAQFSIGRLYETLGNFSAASDAYRTVIQNWSQMPVWPNLAHSRIAVIEEK